MAHSVVRPVPSQVPLAPLLIQLVAAVPPPGLGLAPLLAQFVPAGLALALVLLFGLLSFCLFALTVS